MLFLIKQTMRREPRTPKTEVIRAEENLSITSRGLDDISEDFCSHGPTPLELPSCFICLECQV